MATRVTEPNEEDWKNKMMNFLKATKNDIATLSATFNSIKWYVDASFAIHKDMRSHTEATVTLGSGVICYISTKQKINTCSSTEAKLVGVDDVVSNVLWTKLFIEAQNIKVNTNVIY
jgi:hypothetical protein